MLLLFEECQIFGAIFFFVLGSLLGSFANVIVLRLPRNESIVLPRSYCEDCKHPLAWYFNIPIFSWLMLRGKCHYCGARFSVQYLLVELLMAFLFSALYLFVGWSWLLLEYLIFFFGLVVCCFIDLKHMILPDVFTLSGIVVGLVGALLNPDRQVVDSIIGIVVGGGFLWLVAYLYWHLRHQEGLGGGDIKLLAWMGAVLGWKAIPFIILVASCFGSIIGLIIAIKERKGLMTAIPFGPYLVVAAMLYVFAGKHLAEVYVSIFLPFL